MLPSVAAVDAVLGGSGPRNHAQLCLTGGSMDDHPVRSSPSLLGHVAGQSLPHCLCVLVQLVRGTTAETKYEILPAHSHAYLSLS